MASLFASQYNLLRCEGPIVIHTTYNTGMVKILAKLELRILTEEVTLVANIYVVELFAWSSRSTSHLALFMFM